ncbi:CTP synthetase, partial [Acinetobacter baumannii]
EVPLSYRTAGLDREVLGHFGLEHGEEPDLGRWRTISERVRNPEGEVSIAIVGKYTGLKDAYKSLTEALTHGGISHRVKVNLEWIEAEVFEREDPAP